MKRKDELPYLLQTVYSGSVVAIASKYWQFVGFNAAGQRRVEVLETAKQFFVPFVDELSRQHPQKAEADGFIQRQLWHHAQTTCDRPFESVKNESPSALCLRCCVSHLIEQSCFQLTQQFGQTYQFTQGELLPLVLDATPRLRSYPQSTYESLTQRILKNFDPTQGNLATWTIRLVRNDRRMNEFLLDHGVYLISDWAILNDSKPKQIERILLEFYQQTPYEAQTASQLLRCYHAVYRGDRLKSGVKGRCHEPTSPQLQRMSTYLQQLDPHAVLEEGDEAATLERLKALASLLREYRITRRGGTPHMGSLDAVDAYTGRVQQIASPTQESEEPDAFLEQYRDQVKASLEDAIETVLNRRIQSLQKKRQFESLYRSWLKGLYLFHCRNVSMGAIAGKIGLNAQYQVSRLLQLKAMRTDIRQEMLVILQKRVLTSVQNYLSDQQIQELDRKLEDILAEQVDHLLDQAAAEASTAQPCRATSLYAERLCQCLSRRMPS